MATGPSPILGVSHGPLTFQMPAGACDCHVHVFGPAEHYPLAPERTYTPGDASIADLERRLAEDWGDAEILAAHKVAREELQGLLERWEQLFEAAQQV